MPHRIHKPARMAALLLGLALALGARADANAVRHLLEQRQPKIAGHIVSVTPAHVLGLYEIYTDDRQIIYTDESVNYLFAGDIHDAHTLKDLTEERLAMLNAIPPSSLPLDQAMKRVKGNGKRLLVLFSDPDCPYCRKLEKELTGITDVTIYTFLYPIDSLHPKASEHSRDIWCAPDRQKAWEDYLLHNVVPPKKSCANPLQQVQELGTKYRLTGTPTLVFGDGRVVAGLLRRDELEKALGPH
ncbi:MAG: DsbC family protein [Betaproteobacteria bacterium]|nr:DsbC family protein [Betaproteobacteria bacterium]